MTDRSSVVGEGTYGCVHKPPLNCVGENRPSNNKVTKLMKDEEAKKELKEYKTMKKVDPKNAYYLGTPKSCKVDDNNYNIKSAENCKLLKENDAQLIKNLSKYSLLVMEDGGDNLESFAKKVAGRSSKGDMDPFWVEAHRVFMGVKAFVDNGVIHHDLKPQNIVYNEGTGRMNFIDFGLMKKKLQVIKKANKSNYEFSLHHWSFPLECKFLNKKAYDKYANRSQKSKHDYIENLLDDSSSASGPISTFLYYSTNKSGNVLNQGRVTQRLLKQFWETMLHVITPGTVPYETLVDTCLDTIDVYGLGLSFLYVVKTVYKKMSAEFVEDLSQLLLGMTDANVMSRTKIDNAITQYEDILEKHLILKRTNKHFNNHVLMDGPLIPVKLENEIETVSIKVEVPSYKEMEQMLKKNPAALDPVANGSKVCPEGKEMNTKTRRCIKKCKTGEARNERFECRKTQRKWRKRRT